MAKFGRGILLHCTVAGAAFAQPLTLARALDLAQNRHPQLQVALAQIDAARAGIAIARAYPNPNASVGTGRQFVRIPGNVTGSVTVMGFEQPLELPGLRQTRFNLADRYRESSELALSQTRLAVLSNVRRTFFQVLRRRAEIGISRETLKLVEDLRQRIQVRVDVGEAGRLELVRADAEVASARTLVNSAELQSVDALAQLQAAIGSPFEPGAVVEGGLDPQATLPPLDEVNKQAIDKHPLLQFLQAEIRRADARVPYEKALARPQTTVRSDVETYPDVPNFRLGIAVTLPFWDKREGQIAEAMALTRQAASVARARQVELLAAIESAYNRYQLTTQQLAAYETGLLQEAEEAVRAAEAAYQLGERGIVEVLDAQRILRIVRLNFVNAQYDRQAALVDLDELRAVDLGGNTP